MTTLQKPRNNVRQRAQGFTLIEILIVITILGILASIAIPSYQASAQKARRAEAKTSLMDAASRQEQFFLNNKSYTLKFDNTGISMANAATDGNSANSESDYYTVSVVAPTAGCPINICFALQAVPQGVQTDDTECATFTLDNTGLKGAGDTDCW